MICFNYLLVRTKNQCLPRDPNLVLKFQLSKHLLLCHQFHRIAILLLMFQRFKLVNMEAEKVLLLIPMMLFKPTLKALPEMPLSTLRDKLTKRHSFQDQDLTDSKSSDSQVVPKMMMSRMIPTQVSQTFDF